MKILFQAPSSSFDPSFWEELYNLKLNILKLESKDVRINGLMNINVLSDKNYYNSLLHLTSQSLRDHHHQDIHHIDDHQTHITHRQDNSILIRGTLRDINTIEVRISFIIYLYQLIFTYRRYNYSLYSQIIISSYHDSIPSSSLSHRSSVTAIRSYCSSVQASDYCLP